MSIIAYNLKLEFSFFCNLDSSKEYPGNRAQNRSPTIEGVIYPKFAAQTEQQYYILIRIECNFPLSFYGAGEELLQRTPLPHLWRAITSIRVGL